jgi:two-component system LytT family response regulator
MMASNAHLRVFVVDDETPARKKILRFLSHQSSVEIVGEAANGHDAIAGIQEAAPDLIFLDIEMPDMDGFGVLEGLPPASLPRVVFVTAHDGYTMRAFQVHAFDYLLKPFDETRFSRVLHDVRDHIARDHTAADSGGTEAAKLAMLIAEIKRERQPPARLLVQQNGRAFFLPLEKIDWAESDRNYLNLHVGAQTYTIRGTIESLQAKLDSTHFLRVNRSAIVRLDFVSELQNWSHGEYQVVLSSGKTVAWTRRYLDQHPELLRKL